MSGSAQWTQIAERGSLLGLRFMVACYRLFGHPLCVVLVNLIVVYYFLTFRTARHASRDYLRRIASHPEAAASLGRPPDLVASFLHFRAFALSILDRIALWLGSEDELVFESVGMEHYDRLLHDDRGAFVVGAHIGNFDALRALAERDSRVVNVLMFTSNAPRINAIFAELSPKARVRVLSVEPESMDTVLKIRACIARGEIVAMLGDRVEPGDVGRSCTVPFFGEDVEIPQAPYLLAGLLGCPLFFMVALRRGPRHYRVFAEVLAERVELPREQREKRIRELALAYVARLEHYCTLSPYEWFNFFDFWRERK